MGIRKRQEKMLVTPLKVKSISSLHFHKTIFRGKENISPVLKIFTDKASFSIYNMSCDL